jgi:uncharacterized protein (TIGR03086 family)
MSNTNTDTDTDILTRNPATSHPTAADPRDLFARAVAVATPVIDGVTPDQFGLPTPCGAFDVSQLLGHILFALDRVATVGRGDELGLVDDELSSDDWSADFRVAADAIRSAWADDSRLTATVTLPWASMTGAQALGTYVNELTTHTWDLARATGQSVAWDDDVIAAALAAIQRELPVADRDAIWQSFLDHAPAEASAGFSPPFANAVTTTADAPSIDRLVAWNGRRP